MKRIFLISVLTILAASRLITVYGCGDKLFSMGKGVRLHSTASFLLYRSRSSKERLEINDPSLTSLLTHDGHGVTYAEGPEQLKEILNKSRIDAVLVDQSLEREISDIVKVASPRSGLYVLASTRVPRDQYMALIQGVLVSKNKAASTGSRSK